jgi:Mg2+/Co2+ transporter CorC
MQEVIEKGHSRVPVYYERETNVIGLILVRLSSAFENCYMYSCHWLLIWT